MPLADLAIIGAILTGFAVFVVALAWADGQTRHLAPKQPHGVEDHS